jgi:hypothetical protein
LDYSVDSCADGGYAGPWWIGESPLTPDREDDGKASTVRILAGGKSVVTNLDEAEPMGVR